MTSRLKTQRNLAFLLAMLVGSSYWLMLLMAISRITSGFVMQLIFLGESLRNPRLGLGRLLSSPAFLTNVAAGLILSVLLFIVLKGLITSVYFFLKTKKYLHSLKIVKKARGVIVFKSNRIHAFTTGFFKPTIYLSSRIDKKKKEKKSQAIVFHELEHQQNLDPLKDFLVNIFKWSLPPLPGKTKFFTVYSTLVELNCDFYAEKRLSSKRPIIEALAEVIGGKVSLAPNPLLVGNFSASTERIRILTGSRPFQIKNLYSPALILSCLILFNAVFISQTSLFLKCNHLTECLRIFFDQEAQITPEKHQECRPVTAESMNSCWEIRN